MPHSLIKHGTMAGYNAELKTGEPCERCRKASRVYRAQFSKKAKAYRQGRPPEYSTHAVIDHLYTGRRNAAIPQKTAYTSHNSDMHSATDASQSEPTPTLTSHETEPQPQPQSQDGPSLAARLKSAMGRMGSESYVNTDDPPDYLHPIDPDPEPADGDWGKVQNSDYVMTEQSLKVIEGNLATYLSVVGITVEMIDPYCGPILADNFDNIVSKWTRVIGRYPSAAKLFMSEGGGTIMAWIGAIQATWPILYALYEHHLGKTVTVEDGQVKRVKKNSQGYVVDATMPPQPTFDYTVN